MPGDNDLRPLGGRPRKSAYEQMLDKAARHKRRSALIGNAMGFVVVYGGAALLLLFLIAGSLGCIVWIKNSLAALS